jgi:7,8-dihydropterin-6-yl-methyl-4-(beta-D-ribofuranosyl)aminobenzene 5'-phosphate synthase
MESVRSVKVVTLADNLVYDSRLLGQWGFSAFIEVVDHNRDAHHIVFDTGSKKQALLFNIKALKIDLSSLEFLVLSHGHYDHTSATVELVKKSQRKVKVLVHPFTFLPRFKIRKKRREYFRIPKGEREADIKESGAQIVATTRPREIIPGIITSGEIKRTNRFEKITWKAMTIIEGKQAQDKVPEDQALFINIKEHGLLAIVGCAHAGIINTLDHALMVTGVKKLYGFIGGTHLIQPKEHRLNKTIKRLKDYDLKLMAPSHCTGHKSMIALNQTFPDAFVLNYAGRTIDTSKKLKDRIF